MVSYTNPVDSVEWQTHRTDFEKTVFLWCRKNNISFFGTYQTVQLSSSDKIVKVTIFELIESFDRLQELDARLGISGAKLFYLTDNLVNPVQSKAFKNIKIISLNELIGMIQLVDISAYETTPSKLFNCFIQRVDSVRQSWFYFLAHNNLLDRGYVSFLLYQYPFYANKTGLELFDYNHYHYKLNNLEHFDRAYTQTRNCVPYQNFIDTGDLTSVVKDTKYSLVLETYAVEDDHIGYCYTEKLYRALQLPTINLFFSQKKSLAGLSKLGFKIDNWLLDIDQLDWIDRQQKLLNILINDTIDFDREILYNNSMYNRNLINDYKKQFLDGHYLDNILTEIIEE